MKTDPDDQEVERPASGKAFTLAQYLQLQIIWKWKQSNKTILNASGNFNKTWPQDHLRTSAVSLREIELKIDWLQQFQRRDPKMFSSAAGF